MTSMDFAGATLAELTDAASDGGQALARRHAPRLLLDENEPYAALATGYTVYRGEAQSVSSKFRIVPDGACVIEYAIWYDWDIQHLYDLEHVWVHVGHDGAVTRVEASRHGSRRRMVRPDGSLPVRDGRTELYSEPGKHAHWADGAEMRAKSGVLIEAMCGAMAGEHGIHLSNRFSDRGLLSATALERRLARLKMKREAFRPAWSFSRSSDDGDGMALVAWPVLENWIPKRVSAIAGSLEQTVPHLAAVFLDCGDTLADEATEEKIGGSEVVVKADLIPGAGEVVHQLADSGYRLALVADGPRATFENILKTHGLWDRFEAHVISGDIGELKPSAKMFAAACDALNLDENDKKRTVMVGNNLERDILGANRFGLISIFLAWSKRRSHRHRLRRERPLLTISHIWKLPDLLERVELSLPIADVTGER
jgi:phosphoglycolate phosphatase-like HAD superfamily hydrolase